MTRSLTPIDISHMPELVRLVEEVTTTNTSRILKKDSKDVALLMPVDTAAKSKRKLGKTKADYEAFKRAAGSWADIDTDTLIKNIYEDRRRSNRQPVKL